MPLENKERVISCGDCRSRTTPAIFQEDGGYYVKCRDCKSLILEINDKSSFERAKTFMPPFGRFIGYSFEQIFDKDPFYLHALARDFDDKRLKRKCLLTIWWKENEAQR